MRGDCSIRIDGLGFTAEEIQACIARHGLLSIEVELSSVAQCACAYCQSTKASLVLSEQETFALIDQAKALGCRRVILVDDESTSYPHLKSLIEDIKAKGLEIELFAGESGVTEEMAQFLHDREIAFQLKNGESLGVFKQAHKDSAVAVAISVTVENAKTIPAMWRQLRIDGIEPRVQIITPQSASESGGSALDPQSARRLFEELGQIDRVEFGKVWELPPSLTGRSCKRHLYACHITPCGTITPCVGVTIPLGNIRTEPLREILRLSDVMEDLRAYQNKVKEPCRSCCQTTDCYGCRGTAFQLTGDYLAGDQLCWKADGVPIPSLPIEVKDLIPHGPSMRMVDQLVQIGERTASTRYTITADSLWIDDAGRLDEAAYIEIIAQSFASSHGFHLTAEQREQHQGLLLGIKDVVISGEARAGDRLLINIRKMARFGDFGIVHGEVRHEDGKLIAAGELKVWRPSEETIKAMST